MQSRLIENGKTDGKILKKHDATKHFWQHPDKTKSRGITNLCRADLSLIIKAITGQNFLAYHQSKLDITISKFCRLCEEGEETMIHLITACPALEQTRKDIFLDQKVGGNHEWSIRRVITFLQFPVINRMLNTKHDMPLKDVLYLDHNYSIHSLNSSY